MDVTNKPLAAAGLISYRYRGAFGWIMIGARTPMDALDEAKRSMQATSPVLDKLEMWNGREYVKVPYN